MTRRWLLRYCLLLPYLLCLFGWGWSGWYRGWVRYSFAGRAVTLQTGYGMVILSTYPKAPGWNVGVQRTAIVAFLPDDEDPHYLLGFGFIQAPETVHYAIPYWFLAAASGIFLPFLWPKRGKKTRGRAFPVEVASEKGSGIDEGRANSHA